MDTNSMIAAALQSYGAANTPKNVAALQQFYATNPDAMERRALGVRGGIHEDNTDVLQLEKNIADVMAKTDGAPVNAQAVEAPPVAAAVGARAQQPQRPAQANPGPQQGYGEAAVPAAQPQGNDWIGPLLTTLLGARAAVRPGVDAPQVQGPTAGAPQARQLEYASGDVGTPGTGNPRGGVSDVVDLNARNLEGPRSGAPQSRALPAPTAQIEGPRGQITDGSLKGNVEDLHVDNVNNRNATTKNARENIMRDDIAEENRTMNATTEAQAKRLADQKRTEELLRKAGKAVGRK